MTLYKDAENQGFFVSPFEAKRIEYIALFHEYEEGKQDWDRLAVDQDGTCVTRDCRIRT